MHLDPFVIHRVEFRLFKIANRPRCRNQIMIVVILSDNSRSSRSLGLVILSDNSRSSRSLGLAIFHFVDVINILFHFNQKMACLRLLQIFKRFQIQMARFLLNF